MSDPGDAPESTHTVTAGHASIARWHLRFGWWLLLGFMGLGMLLEAMHGLKIGWYLDVSNETRRLVWTLAHAHGALIGILHIGFAVTLPYLPDWPARSRDLASKLLTAGGILMPGGFFLGGFGIYDGDPGLGVFFSPVGGFMLLASILITAMGVQRYSSAD